MSDPYVEAQLRYWNHRNLCRLLGGTPPICRECRRLRSDMAVERQHMLARENPTGPFEEAPGIGDS